MTPHDDAERAILEALLRLQLTLINVCWWLEQMVKETR